MSISRRNPGCRPDTLARSGTRRLVPALTLCLACWGLIVAQTAPASAQVRPTNEVTRCTLIVEPTAQRACIESALQSRPAATFDPTVQKPRADRPSGKSQDSTNTRTTGLPINNGVVPSAPIAKSPQEGFRETKWRLQIP